MFREHYAIQNIHPPADTRHIRRKFLDIPYAHLSPSQKLDIYLPDEGGRALSGDCVHSRRGIYGRR
jgi:hypothetical protein